MLSSVHTGADNCRERPQTATRIINQRKLELFSAVGPLESVLTDILAPLPGIQASKQFVVIKTDVYTKLTREIKTTKITTTHV